MTIREVASNCIIHKVVLFMKEGINAKTLQKTINIL